MKNNNTPELGNLCMLLSLILLIVDIFDIFYLRFYHIIAPVVIYLFWEFAFAFKEGMDEAKRDRENKE